MEKTKWLLLDTRFQQARIYDLTEEETNLLEDALDFLAPEDYELMKVTEYTTYTKEK